MTITKTVIANSPSRTVVKVVATGAETITINMKTAAVPTSATLTFSATAKTIVRAAGDWTADFGAPIGAVVSITISGGSTLNLKTVVGIITATNTITVNDWYTLTNETSVAVSNSQWSGYWSDIAFPGQQLGNSPKANITKLWYSLDPAGKATIVRNSATVFSLFGYNTLEGFGVAEQNAYSTVVTFTATGGTVIIEFVKLDDFYLSPSQTAVGS